MRTFVLVFVVSIVLSLSACKSGSKELLCPIGEEFVEEECIDPDGPLICDVDYINTDQLCDFTHDDITRKFLLYIPDGYDLEDMPLVVVLHGYTATVDDIRSQTGFNDIADQEGFAVVYPQGYLLNGFTHFNVGLDSSTVDDVGFITRLIDYLQDTFLFSEEYVFITGLSNGGYMSYTMVIEHPEYFKAMASVAGVISYHPWQKESYDPINVLHIHGTGDEVVPIDGSWPYDDGWGDVPGLDVMLERWKAVNETTASNQITISDNTTLYQYTNETDDLHVWYYDIEGYGHNWPVDGVKSERVDPEFNASEVIWEFFSQFIQE